MTHDTNANGDGRDDQGRFLPGSRAAAGHGGSRARARLARALHAAVDEETIIEIVGDLRAIAADASLEPGARIAAMRLLLDHAIGKPAECPSDAVVDLPTTRSAADIVEAVVRVFEALGHGDVDVREAVQLVDALSKAGDAIVWRGLVERVETLERERRR